jgi:hypothetical protein
MSWRRPLIVISVACAVVLPTVVVRPAATAAPRLPVFRVGTAVVDVTPHRPQYLGGFGAMKSPTAHDHDPLQVRAFVVRRAGAVLAFAVADTQGWFAAYQEGPYGIDDVRTTAARWLRAHGAPHAGAADIAVSSTHSHAAPTVMGIWGPTDVTYLRRLHDATVTAIERAASQTRRAQLWTADADISDVIGQTVAQTDIYDGWSVDGDTPVLWARDPDNGRTIGLYANVPVHADIVDGAKLRTMSADHIGVARGLLGRDLGGTAVLAMGTLGRQESIVQTAGLARARDVGAFVANRIRTALAGARPVTDPTLAAASVRIRVPGTNPLLLGLMALGRLDRHLKLPGVDLYPLDRALHPPYFTGALVGTSVSLLRIGHLAYVTEPGEAFPEVSAAVRRTLPELRTRVVGMAGDQLGYYFPATDAPFTTLINSSDHLEYNTSVRLAAATLRGVRRDGRALGLRVRAARPGVGTAHPLGTRDPGVQFFAVPPSGPGLSVRFDTAWNKGKDRGALIGNPRMPVRFDFGDGTSAYAGAVTQHRYAHAGSYRVTAVVGDTKGRSRRCMRTVIVGAPIPALPPVVAQARGGGSGHAPGRASAAVYDVGIATRSINPTPKMLAGGDFHLGGYGLGGGKIVGVRVSSGRVATGILGDGVRAHALVIGDGARAIALAEVDTQGYFAAYQAGPYGTEAIRRDAAARIARLSRGSDDLPAGAILVNSTHSHSGPDTVGAWGGVPTSYLRLVHDRTVQAIVAAWRHRRPAQLYYGTASGGVRERGDPDALIHNQFGTDRANATVDDTLRVIQARGVADGRTIVTYVNFAAHPTVLGSDNTLVSADYPAALDRLLASTYGGAGFDQVGTLGRTQPAGRGCPDRRLTGSAASTCSLTHYAERVLSRVRTALRTAAPLTGPPQVAMHSYRIRALIANPVLLGLFDAGKVLDAQLMRRRRPWTVGPVLTTMTFSGRIGPLLLSGSPGEPYPPVVLNVRSAVPGMLGYLSIGTAGDFLGYLIAPVGAYPDVLRHTLTGNDNALFNVSPTIGAHVSCSLLRGAGDVLGRGLHYWRAQPSCAVYGADLAAGRDADTRLPD